MIGEEINYFPDLKNEIIKRFDYVTSYKELVLEYCQMINQYFQEIYQIN